MRSNHPIEAIPKVEASVRTIGARLCAAGFTLLELLVVMVIIGLLASYVAPRLFQQVGKSEIKTVQEGSLRLRSELCVEGVIGK